MRLLGKKQGDKLVLNTPIHGNVEYTIAGVVWSPGVDVIVTMYDMERQFDQRTASSMFGSLEDAKRDFGVADVTLYAANLDYNVNKLKLQKEMEAEAEGPRRRAATSPTTQSTLAGAFKWLGGSTTKPGDQMGQTVFHGVKELLGLISNHQRLGKIITAAKHRGVCLDGGGGTGRGEHDHGVDPQSPLAVRRAAQHRPDARPTLAAGVMRRTADRNRQLRFGNGGWISNDDGRQRIELPVARFAGPSGSALENS
jgi:hypothetical protein